MQKNGNSVLANNLIVKRTDDVQEKRDIIGEGNDGQEDNQSGNYFSLGSENKKTGTAVGFVRKKRSVAAAVKWTFTGIGVACEVGKLLHKAAIDNGIGIYGRLNQEMQEYRDGALKNKELIRCRKNHLEILNERLLASFSTYKYSIYLFGAAQRAHKKLEEGMKLLGNLDEKNLQVDFNTPAIHTIQKMAVVDVKAQSWLDVSVDVAEGIAWTVTVDAIEATVDGFVVDLVNPKGYIQKITGKLDINPDWGNIPIDGGLTPFEILDGAGDILNIVGKIVKIASCIKDHFNMVAKTKENRDHLKEQFELTKVALKHLNELTRQMDEAVEMFNTECDKLVQYTNAFLKLFDSECTSSAATLVSDLTELNDYVHSIKDNFDIKVEIDATLKTMALIKSSEIQPTLKQNLLEDMGKNQYKKLRSQYPNTDGDVLIEKMVLGGFLFPKEQWTNWTKISDDEDCNCKEVENCQVEFERTCLSNEECIGPKRKIKNRCDAAKYHLSTKCASKDKAFKGNCLTEGNRTVVKDDVAGQYVSTRVNETQCYKDCKNLPGSQGCQYVRRCLTDFCTGDCFAFTEPVKSGDNFPDTTCYSFRSTSPGVASEFLIKKIKILSIIIFQALLS